MAKVLERKRGEYITSYTRQFDREGEWNWGWSFDCDKDGNIDHSKLYPAGVINLEGCLKGECQGIKVVDRGVQTHTDWRRGHIKLECGCGRTVICEGYDYDCKCGRVYNGVGQELAPRKFWDGTDGAGSPGYE